MLRFMTALMGALLLMQSAFADTVKPEIGKYVFWLSWAGRRCGVDDADRAESL